MAETLDLDWTRCALLLMDFQNDIATAGGKMAPDDAEALARFDAAVAAANKAAAAARTAGVPVVQVAVGRRPGEAPFNPNAPMFAYMAGRDALVEGTEGFAFRPDSQPAEGDVVIVKRGVSAFAGTSLGQWLHGHGVDTVVLTGLVTHWVVEGTARHAADLGYRVVVLADGCASGGLERHDGALANIGMIGTVSDTAAFIAAIE
jgi:nicotinamidase-related amidase